MSDAPAFRHKFRWSALVTALAVALFTGAVWLLHRELAAYHYHDILRALEALPASRVAAAIAVTVLSYGILGGYDLLGLRYAQKSLPYRKVAFASAVSYAFSNSLGVSTVTGSLVRMRVYSTFGLGALEIARVAAFAAVTFWVGILVAGGLAFTLDPIPTSRLLPGLATTLPIGVLFLVLAAAWLLACGRVRRPLRLRGWEFALPSLRLAAGQTLVGAADWVVASLVLFVLLPPDTGLSYATVLGTFLLAQVAGVVSHVPGGLGVFESTVLVVLGPWVPAPHLVATLVLYRLVYYLAPLAVAAVLLAGHELLQARVAVGRTLAVASRWMAPVAPTVFALLTFTAGLLLLFSGATPAVGARLDAMHGIVPVPVIEASHFLGSLAGAALLVVARGLYLRLDAAWLATLLSLAAGIAFSLLKGLDFEEATLLALLAGALWPARAWFYRRSSLLAQPLTSGWLLATGLALGTTAWLMMFAFRHVDYSHDLWWHFSLYADAPRSMRAMVGAAGLLLLFSLSRVLRVQRFEPRPPTPEELDRAERITRESDRTMAWLSVTGDKSLMFSDDGSAFLMFAVEGRAWVCMGDPVGPASQRVELAWRFKEACDRHAAWPVFYQVAPENLPLYLDLGLSTLKLGEEARVDLRGFSLEGHARKPLRNAVRRAEREGCSFEVLPPQEVPAILPQLRAVSDAWLADKGGREKGFSLGFFGPAYLARCSIAVVRREGAIVAFANLWPGVSGSELSFDLMRYGAGAPGGTMDYLLAELMQWGTANGYAWFNLGMAPLSGFPDRVLAPTWAKLGAFVFRHGEAFYGFSGLRQYKEKFGPTWQPRYLASPGGFALPPILAWVTRLISVRPPAALVAALVVVVALAGASAPAHALDRSFDLAAFGRVHIVEPAQAAPALASAPSKVPAQPHTLEQHVLLFISGDGGWDARARAIAAQLASTGALVAGIDIRSYRDQMKSRGAACVYAAADFEGLSQQVQKRLGRPTYTVPVLVGHSSGATLAYAVLAQAPLGTFQGAVSLGFHPELESPRPLCERNGLRTKAGGRSGLYLLVQDSRVPLPWTDLHGADDKTTPVEEARAFVEAEPEGRLLLLPGVGHGFAVASSWLPQFRAALARIEARAAPRPAPRPVAPTPAAARAPIVAPAVAKGAPVLAPLPDAEVDDLPINEVPADVQTGDRMAILITGDGGWAGLDRSIAGELAAHGVPTVGLSSLKYFWNERTPAEASADLSRLIRHYLHVWHKTRVVLVGYSFGADALPVMVAHLPAPEAQRISALALLGPSTTYELEFHVGGWVGVSGSSEKALLPVLSTVAARIPVLGLYGSEETDTACKSPKLPRAVQCVALPGGHHFGGDYQSIAKRILAFPPPPTIPAAVPGAALAR